MDASKRALLHEMQENEVEVLQAIYMDNFVPITATTAWKITGPRPPEFAIHLWPHGDEDLRRYVSVDLHVKFRQTYPQVAPDVKVENPNGLSKSQVHELMKLINEKVKELIGQEMIYEICTLVQDHLLLHNSSIRHRQVSSHEQMLERLEKSSRAEQERAEIEHDRLVRLAKSVQLDDDMALSEEIREELEKKEEAIRKERERRKQLRRENHKGVSDLSDFSNDELSLDEREENVSPTRRKASKRLDRNKSGRPHRGGIREQPGHVIFDSYFTLEDDPTQTFQSVMIGVPVGKAPSPKVMVYSAKPVESMVAENSMRHRHGRRSHKRGEMLALKEIILEEVDRKKLQELEKEISRATELRHPGIISVYKYNVDKEMSPRGGDAFDSANETLQNGNSTYRDVRTSVTRVQILMELASGGSLEDLLRRCGGRLECGAGQDMALTNRGNGDTTGKRYMRELLHALVHLHACGFVHRDIKLSNILLQDFDTSSERSGSSTRPKFVDVAYGRRLKDIMTSCCPHRQNAWPSPEVDDDPMQYGRKNDIWCLGVVFAQMALGIDLVQVFNLPSQMLDANQQGLSQPFYNLLTKMLSDDPRKRPTALELLGDPFFFDTGGGQSQGLGGPFGFQFTSQPRTKSVAAPLTGNSAKDQQRFAALALAAETAGKYGMDAQHQGRPLKVNLLAQQHQSPTMRQSEPVDDRASAYKSASDTASGNDTVTDTSEIDGWNRRELAEPIQNGLSGVGIGMFAPSAARPPEIDGRSSSQYQLQAQQLFPQPQLSRYRSDFEEIEFLGKGGFGEVVKARNKLDGRFYAIKKVRLNPVDIENNRKILREITAISRLQHAFVVRYFSTWIEDADGACGDGSSDSDEDECSEDECSSECSGESLSTSSPYGFGDEKGIGYGLRSNPLKFVDDFLSMEGDRSKSYASIRFTNPDSTTDEETTDADDREDDTHPFGFKHRSSVSSGDPPEQGLPPIQTSAIRTRSPLDRGKKSGGKARKAPPQKKKREENETVGTVAPPMRMMYIQMEYCEKKTLRDVIDEGIDEDEAWRYLRQILEGLVHIHGQRMIHRDLKPSNIFLDASGNVKIGDFGLATSTALALEPGYSRNASYEKECSDGGCDDSLTTGVGTTFYVSPEVVGANYGSRYNQKVDMYSLGIIFFEICFPFRTAMERSMILRDLRNIEIIFPKEFSTSEMKNQSQIIRWLLQHDPKERPTSVELLQSELLPPKLEDEYIQECVRAIANPNTPYYKKLMAALFAQSCNRHRDYTYDFNSENPMFDQYHTLFVGKVKEHISKVFRIHGALELDTPLLMPKLDIYDTDKKPASFMDSNGGLVQLPYDLTVPFARFVARNGILSLKRFTFGEVYRENIVGGQPKMVAEVDFDIVHSTDSHAVVDAEMLKILDNLFDGFPPIHSSGFFFRVSHYWILEAIFETCRIPAKDRKAIASVLGQFGTRAAMSQIRGQLVERFRLPRSVVEELEMFNVQGDIESVERKLLPLVKHDRARLMLIEGIDHLKSVASYAASFNIRHRIVFTPFLSYNRHYYQEGILIQCIRDSKGLDVLAAGGRYDRLVDQFRHPATGGSSKKIRAIGVNIAIAKIIDAINRYQADILKSLFAKKSETERSFGLWAPKKCDVYVASFSQSLLHERIAIVRELWAANIKADFQYFDGGNSEEALTPDQLTNLCKYQGINWIVIVKGAARNEAVRGREVGGTVKVKNVLRKVETEVSRFELCIWLTGEINEQTRVDYAATGVKFRKQDVTGPSPVEYGTNAKHDSASASLAAIPGSNNREPSVIIVNHPNSRNKLNHTKKNMLIDKSISNVSKLLDGHIPIMAVDLSRDVLRKMVPFNVLDEESSKKVAEFVSTSQKDYLFSVLKIMREQHRERNRQCVFLYSTKDDANVLYEFFT